MNISEHLTHFKIGNIKCHWGFWLLPKSFLAITLFGHIFFNKSKKELLEYLKTDRAAITINHELIHIIQANSFKTKYLGFYIYYLYYWIKNLFKYGVKDHIAYRNIPFEREAFANEYDSEYMISKWKTYID